MITFMASLTYLVPVIGILLMAIDSIKICKQINL